MNQTSLALAALWRRVSPPVRGILLIAAAALGFSAMHTMIRFLSGDLHAFQIAFFRNFFGLVVLLPTLLGRGFRRLRTDRLALHVGRSLLQLCSMLLFFTALGLAPLARVSALSFTAPLFATLGAILFLGERVHARRTVALSVGLLGALVVLRPTGEIDTGTIMVVLASAVWAVALLMIKVISRTDSTITLALYMGLLMAPMSLLPALFVWRWPAPVDYLWLFVMGLIGVLSHLAMGQAFREADATIVLPVDFTRLIWASLLGFVFFQEIPALSTWIGGGLIFGSATFIAYRESRLK